MIVTQYVQRSIIGGLLAGMLAFGGLYAWNAGQGSTGIDGDSSQLATTGTGGQIANRD